MEHCLQRRTEKQAKTSPIRMWNHSNGRSLSWHSRQPDNQTSALEFKTCNYGLLYPPLKGNLIEAIKFDKHRTVNAIKSW